VVTDAGSFGPKCAAALYGAKPVRVKFKRQPTADERQIALDWFGLMTEVRV
jgi:hypothetical protein